MHIYVIERQTLIREALICLLESVGRNVSGSALEWHESTEDPGWTLASVVVFAVSGSDNSFRELERLKEVDPDKAVLVLADSCEAGAVNRSLLAGADGFLVKSAHVSELLRALELVAGGGCYLHPEVLVHVVADIRGSSLPAASKKIPSRELQVLTLLADGLSNAEIAQRLFVSRSTVKNHVRSLFHHFSSSDRTKLVVEAIRAGVISAQPAPLAP